MVRRGNWMFRVRCSMFDVCLKIVQIFQCPAKNPRIIKRATPDAHAGATGFVEHLFGGLGSDDVAVADDGDIFDRFNHFADAGELDGAAEALFAGAAVDENGGDAGVFEGAGEVGGGQVGVIPAESHLGGDGNFDGVDHAADEGGGFIEFGHHGRAAADFADFPNGAAHVDVDGLDADGFEVEGGVAHFPGHAAEQLDGEGTVGGAGFDQFERFGVLFEQGPGVDEVGGAEADAADFAHGQPEWQV